MKANKAAKNPTCGNCMFYTDKGKPQGPCQMLPGKAVKAGALQGVESEAGSVVFPLRELPDVLSFVACSPRARARGGVSPAGLSRSRMRRETGTRHPFRYASCSAAVQWTVTRLRLLSSADATNTRVKEKLRS